MKILYNDGNPFGLKLLLCAKFGEKDVNLAKVALNGKCTGDSCQGSGKSVIFLDLCDITSLLN